MPTKPDDRAAVAERNEVNLEIRVLKNFIKTTGLTPVEKQALDAALAAYEREPGLLKNVNLKDELNTELIEKNVRLEAERDELQRRLAEAEARSDAEISRAHRTARERYERDCAHLQARLDAMTKTLSENIALRPSSTVIIKDAADELALKMCQYANERDEAQAHVERLRAALEKVGGDVHDYRCSAKLKLGPCDCGHAEAVAALAETAGE